MTEKSKFAERLNEAMDAAGVPRKGMGRQSALARTLDVNQRNAKKWLEGKEYPPTSKLVRIAHWLGVRSNWLLSGQGDMVAAVMQETSDPAVTEEASVLSTEAFQLASDWMQLPHPQREALRRVIAELARQQLAD